MVDRNARARLRFGPVQAVWALAATVAMVAFATVGLIFERAIVFVAIVSAFAAIQFSRARLLVWLFLFACLAVLTAIGYLIADLAGLS